MVVAVTVEFGSLNILRAVEVEIVVVVVVVVVVVAAFS